MDASMEPDSSSFIYEMQDLISPDLISPKMLAGLTEGNFWSKGQIHKGIQGDKIRSLILFSAVSWCKFGRMWLQI